MGGTAIAAFSTHPHLNTTARFAFLDLPKLTSHLVEALIETRLQDNAHQVIGGFDVAQKGKTLEVLSYWPGTTLRAKAEALHAACATANRRGSLDEAVQELLVTTTSELACIIDEPLEMLSHENRAVLEGTLTHAVLRRELARCLEDLAEAALRPLLAWLIEQGAMSLTLIPCGALAAFPLVAAPMPDGRTLGEALPTSIAPSARSLLQPETLWPERAGICALGNPYPVPPSNALPWGEAEASSLAQLGEHLTLPTKVAMQYGATRSWLIDALHRAWVVDASCHGSFDDRDFLRSRLLLANGETLTLADLLSSQVDLQGLRLLILSACQTALLDLRGAREEVRSLATGMLQAGARAVLAALWAVDDQATYLLMVRFAQEWFPTMDSDAPAAAFIRAQRWLRTVTNRELEEWQGVLPQHVPEMSELVASGESRLVRVRGRGYRFDSEYAQELIQVKAGLAQNNPEAQPYAAPYFWAGFQINGW